MTLTMQLSAIGVANVLSLTNAQFSQGMYSLAAPEFKGVNGTEISAENVIAPIGGFNSIEIDGDLILTADWGYGFSIHRIGDDGHTTLLYRDWAGDFGTCYLGMGIDKTRGVAYCGNMNQNFIEKYDYSAWKNGGTGPTVIGTRLTVDNTGINNLMSGYWYFGGLYLCGDYLYVNRYPAVSWQQGASVTRINTQTLVGEMLAVTRGYNNIGYGGFTYDPVTDRLYMSGVGGEGGINIIVHPSSITPDCYGVYTGGVGMANDQYPEIYCDGDELVVWTHGYRVWRINIAPCLVDTNVPTVVWAGLSTNTNSDGFTGLHGCWKPDGLDMAIIRSDRDIARASGWIDLDNGVLVGAPGDPQLYQHHYLGASYAGVFKKITSAGASPTTYWMWGAYGWYGHCIRVFAENSGPRLQNSWDIIFGTFTLPGSVNIKSGYFLAPGTIPSGCSLTYYASNDNGGSWQTITENTIFDFVTTGHQAQIKVAGTGTDEKSAYIRALGSFNVLIMDQPSTYAPSMAQRLKLAGVS